MINAPSSFRRIRPSPLACFALAGLVASSACAQLEVVPDALPQAVFFGDARPIRATFRNADAKPVDIEARVKIFQTSSATAGCVSESSWKKLQVLAGQTVIESASLKLSAVKAETRFVVQWLENTNKVIGTTDVLVYPTNLLEELKLLIGDEESLGVFDPSGQLKPLLKKAKVGFVDLGDAALENYRGKLAIFGPFQSKAQMQEDLPPRIQTIARKGVAVVWLRPPLEKHDKLQPSFYSVLENQIATVVVQPDLVANLAENPRSQLNLVYFCKLALHPEPAQLPDLTPQP